jgi:ribonuclease HII
MTLYRYETSLLEQGYRHIAGCDEVGRGPLAGPVVAAAVILDPSYIIEGLNDSKKLSESKREGLAKEIIEHAIAYHISYVSPEQIDQINIYEASRKAMLDAIKHLQTKPDYVLSDAMPLPTLSVPHQSIIKGDANSATIAAASILAKVSRDHYMVEMAHTYPGYGFERHKGYPTKQHLTALAELGVTPIHRKTYAPVRKLLEKQLTFDL